MLKKADATESARRSTEPPTHTRSPCQRTQLTIDSIAEDDNLQVQTQAKQTPGRPERLDTYVDGRCLFYKVRRRLYFFADDFFGGSSCFFVFMVVILAPGYCYCYRRYTIVSWRFAT